jgi:hypothetical protein
MLVTSQYQPRSSWITVLLIINNIGIFFKQLTDSPILLDLYFNYIWNLTIECFKFDRKFFHTDSDTWYGKTGFHTDSDTWYGKTGFHIQLKLWTYCLTVSDWHIKDKSVVIKFITILIKQQMVTCILKGTFDL